MSEFGRIERRSGYLYAELVGAYDLGNVMAFFDEVLVACAAHGTARILLDIRKLEGEIPILDRFRFSEFVAGSRASIARIAFIVRQDQLLADRFAESALRNRGVLAFGAVDVDEAVRWLEAPSPD